MVKVQLREILSAQNALKNLMEMKLPVKAAFRVQKIARKLFAELEDFEKVRLALIEKYAPETGDDQPKKVPDEKLGEFSKDIEQVLEEEVELDIQQIPLGMVEGTELTVEDVLLLAFIFEDPELT